MLSRRTLLASSAALATIANEKIMAASARSKAPAAKGPFDNFRDYVAAMEAYGFLLRFDRIVKIRPLTW